jgi:serine palmitoyltransferase
MDANTVIEWLTPLLEWVFAQPYHLAVEAILFVVLLVFLFKGKRKDNREKLSKAEEDELIAEWNPEVLVPDTFTKHHIPIVSSACGGRLVVDGKDCLNLATVNFLGLAGRKDIAEEAKKSVDHYGCGTCGPRGFYGTLDVHLTLEDQIATFLGTDEAILYTYSYATITSLVPAFSKRNDLIVCDDGVSFPVQNAISLARSKVRAVSHEIRSLTTVHVFMGGPGVCRVSPPSRNTLFPCFNLYTGQVLQAQ